MTRTMPTKRLRLDHDPNTGVYYTRWTGDHRRRHKRTFGSDRRQAEIRFAEFYALWKVSDQVRNPAANSEGPLTVRQLWDDHFEPHARDYYRRADGTPTGEATNIEHAFGHVLTLFGSTPAAEFDATKLIAARDAMVDAGLSRNVVNQRVRKVRQVFRWAHSEGRALVPPAVLMSLESVKALKQNRSAARETDDVTPVADSIVEATIAHCPPTLAAMIRVQRLTGMRPGEVCIMRACDIDRRGDVWLYRPAQHKLAHVDTDRVIALGPKSQRLLEPMMTMDLAAYLFSPLRARHEREVTTAATLGKKRPRKTDRRVGDHYTAASYYRAIQYAAKRAGVPGWSPNQLRHAWATEARQRGVKPDVIQAQLGHTQARTTEGYAHLDPMISSEYQQKWG